MAFAVLGDTRVFATTADARRNVALAETRVFGVEVDGFRGTGSLPSNIFPVVFPFRLG